jgi:hypothetical protein
MISKKIMGGGAIFLAFLIEATLIFELPQWLHYVWALLALIWGIITLIDK